MKIQPGCRRRNFWRASRQSPVRAHVALHQAVGDNGEQQIERIVCQSIAQKEKEHESLADLSDQLNAALALTNASSQGIPQVLHIDPDVNIAVMLSDALEPQVQVHHSRTIAEARHLLKTDAFNLVIIDPELPDCDLADLRALLPNAHGNTALLILSNRAAGRVDEDSASLRMIKSRTSNQHLLATVQSLIGVPE